MLDSSRKHTPLLKRWYFWVGVLVCLALAHFIWTVSQPTPVYSVGELFSRITLADGLNAARERPHYTVFGPVWLQSQNDVFLREGNNEIHCRLKHRTNSIRTSDVVVSRGRYVDGGKWSGRIEMTDCEILSPQAELNLHSRDLKRIETARRNAKHQRS